MQPLPLLLLMNTTQLSAGPIVWVQEEKIDHEKMAAEFKKAGGKVEVDAKSPGKPNSATF